jgi:folate-binding protein YgfZ
MTATHLTNRAVIRLSGEDVRGFLNGLVTNDVAGDLPVWAALLTPQGKVLFDFIVWEHAGDLLLDCEAEQAEALCKRVSLYRLRRPIRISIDQELRVNWSTNEPSPAIRRQLIDSGPLPPIVAGDPRVPELGYRWLMPNYSHSADSDWLAHRLSQGVCEGPAELADLLWLECNAAELNGVSFTKGCYVGQENTARMNWRAKVNRRLVVVPLAESNPARQRVAYPELGLAVDHRRVEDIPERFKPDWLQPA